jgi:protein-S-isoprenylcysteine O-methyltransferase Ste14
MSEARDASSNFIWPPMIYGAAVFISLALWWFAPLAITGRESLRAALLIAGGALVCSGGAIALLAEFSFKRARTAVLPTRPTTAIVAHGPYRFTRNPMYLGMSLALAGCAGVLNSWWFLIALPFAMFAVTKLAIEREEAYLERKFAGEYLDYKARVRRWI